MTDRPDLTMMYGVHAAFRRDVQRLTAALVDNVTDPVRRDAVAANWNLFHSLLEHHHQAEDRVLWVEVLAAVSDATAVIDAMAEQHDALDALLEDTHQTMQEWAVGDAPAPLPQLNAVSALLNAHLDDEEQKALPLVAEHTTVASWQRFTSYNMALNEGVDWVVPWLAEGKPEQVRAAIWGMMPAAVESGRADEWAASYEANIRDAFEVTAPAGP